MFALETADGCRAVLVLQSYNIDVGAAIKNHA